MTPAGEIVGIRHVQCISCSNTHTAFKMMRHETFIIELKDAGWIIDRIGKWMCDQCRVALLGPKTLGK